MRHAIAHLTSGRYTISSQFTPLREQLMQYEALYQNGKIVWLTQKPPIHSARIAISILEEFPPSTEKRRQPSPLIAGKAKITGDLVSPIVDENDWECLK